MYKDLSLKEKAKVIREGVRLGLTSIDDILNLYDDAISHKFAEGSIATPDWDPSNPYHYHTASGEKVVITPEDWEKHKGLPYFKQVEDAVLAEQAAYQGPEYIINPQFSEDLRRVYKGNMGPLYQNYSSFSGNLPQGYSFTPEGLVQDNKGNLYVQKEFRLTPRFTYNENNPLTFPVLEGRNQSNVTFYPVNMEKSIKQSIPVNKVFNVRNELDKVLSRYKDTEYYPMKIRDFVVNDDNNYLRYGVSNDDFKNAMRGGANHGYWGDSAWDNFSYYINNLFGNGTVKSIYEPNDWGNENISFNKRQFETARNKLIQFHDNTNDDDIRNYIENMPLFSNPESFKTEVKSRKKDRDNAVIEVGPLQVSDVLTYAKGGKLILDNNGYYAHPKYNKDGTTNDMLIKGDSTGTNITMRGIPFKIAAWDNLGNYQELEPNGEYYFPGSMVREHALQLGGLAKPFSYEDIPDVRYLKEGYLFATRGPDTPPTKYIDAISTQNDVEAPIEYLYRYVNSDAFANKAPSLEYIDTARGNVSHFKGVKSGLWDYLFGPTTTNSVIYMPKKKEFIIPNDEAITYDDVLAHEFGHIIDPMNKIQARRSSFRDYEYRDASKEYKNLLDSTIEKRYNMHDNSDNEKYADLQMLRWQLYNSGIFDATKNEKFTKEHLNKALKAGLKKKSRTLLMYDDKTVIDIMNTIASNQDTSNIVSNGGHLFQGLTNSRMTSDPYIEGLLRDKYAVEPLVSESTNIRNNTVTPQMVNEYSNTPSGASLDYGIIKPAEKTDAVQRGMRLVDNAMHEDPPYNLLYFSKLVTPLMLGKAYDNIKSGNYGRGLLDLGFATLPWLKNIKKGAKFLWNDGKIIQKEMLYDPLKFYRIVGEDAIKDAKKTSIIKGDKKNTGQPTLFNYNSDDLYYNPNFDPNYDPVTNLSRYFLNPTEFKLANPRDYLKIQADRTGWDLNSYYDNLIDINEVNRLNMGAELSIYYPDIKKIFHDYEVYARGKDRLGQKIRPMDKNLVDNIAGSHEWVHFMNDRNLDFLKLQDFTPPGMDFSRLDPISQKYFTNFGGTESNARAALVLNWLGITKEKVTPEMIKFARDYYSQSTGIYNDMNPWFYSIKDFDKFADWINKYKGKLFTAPVLGLTGLSVYEDKDGGDEYKKGGSIYIKPENRGKFTALKKRTGHSASWFKAHGTPALKKMATFALNARHWKHDDGGYLYSEGGFLLAPYLYVE